MGLLRLKPSPEPSGTEQGAQDMADVKDLIKTAATSSRNFTAHQYVLGNKVTSLDFFTLGFRGQLSPQTRASYPCGQGRANVQLGWGWAAPLRPPPRRPGVPPGTALTGRS